MAENQNPQQIVAPTLENVLRLSNQQQGNLIKKISTIFGSQSANLSSLSIVNSTSGGFNVSDGSGYLIAISVNVASTGATGTIYDADDGANVSSSNIMGVIPSSVGLTVYNLPYFNGITVQPSSGGGHSVSVYYTVNDER